MEIKQLIIELWMIKEEIKKQMKIFLELKENENTTQKTSRIH